MEKPTLIKKSQTFTKQKNHKTVWEYNSGQFKTVDIAKTSLSGRYPEKGYSSNAKSTMLYYILSGTVDLTLETNETFHLEPEDVFILPPQTWYYIKGECEALMVCSPTWAKDQSLQKES